jgi:glycosyltransferase involved in cell wall biosynthesis
VTDLRRLMFLNRSYWPDVEATGQLLTELCEELVSTDGDSRPDVSRRYRIEVVVGKPNETRESEGDTDWQLAQSRNGVHIRRVPHWQLSKRNMLLKSLNYMSFIRATGKYLKSCEAPDVVIFETDPFLLPFEAARLRRRTGCRVIGYLQDIYPDVAVALGKVPNNWAIRKLRASLFAIYRTCNCMVVLSEDMKALLVAGGVDPEKIAIIPNWCDPESVQPVQLNRFRERFELADRFVVMYSGNLGLTQRLEEFVAAAELLKDDPRIVFAFVGQGSQKPVLEADVRRRQLTNVRFYDYQPKSELAHSLSAADLHLVPLTRELSQCLMPSKLYGILAAGRPYLTNAVPESELHRITREHQLGLIVKPGSVEAIAHSIREAVSKPDHLKTLGENARKLALTEFTREKSVQKFRTVLESVLSGQSLFA